MSLDNSFNLKWAQINLGKTNVSPFVKSVITNDVSYIDREILKSNVISKKLFPRKNLMLFVWSVLSDLAKFLKNFVKLVCLPLCIFFYIGSRTLFTNFVNDRCFVIRRNYLDICGS